MTSKRTKPLALTYIPSPPIFEFGDTHSRRGIKSAVKPLRLSKRRSTYACARSFVRSKQAGV